MKLQLALDFVDVPTALEILQDVHSFIDIVEVGTPFVVDQGLSAVRTIKAAYPELMVLADLKIMDAGAQETRMAAEAGADIITALGVSDDRTIKGCVETAHAMGKKVMIDMIGVPDLEKRAAEVDQLNVDYICVHTAFDVQATGVGPLEELHRLQKVIHNAKTAVAGGVKYETVQEIVMADPEIIIVGGGITGKADRQEAARLIKERMGG